jgi:phosphotransferase system HPr (HPr) family protein
MKTSLQITINHSAGLHARPASLFVQTANKFTSAISVQNITAESAISNAKSILSVLTLGVVQGHEIEIVADGEDAEEAIAALESLILNNFGE